MSETQDAIQKLKEVLERRGAYTQLSYRYERDPTGTENDPKWWAWAVYRGDYKSVGHHGSQKLARRDASQQLLTALGE
jgi:dsRNA-specific ribonuclease